MYAFVTLRSEETGALTLPASAVIYDGKASYGYRIVEGKAVRTPVEAGIRDGERVEILKKQTTPAAVERWNRWEDLTGDEDFVLRPSRLTDGQAVSVKADTK